MEKKAIKEMQRFERWMLKIKNVHYADNKRMSNAYIKVYLNMIK